MNQSKVITFLRSSEFAIWVAILSMIVQSFHSFTAFYNTSSLQNYWGIGQAILFAIVIDSAILFYTVRNRTDIAWGAAFIMVVINSYYYYQHLGLTFQFAFGVFLSLIIPVSVYFYSEEVGKENKKDDQDWREKYFLANATVRELEDINGKLKNQLHDLEFSGKTYRTPEDNSLLDIQHHDPDYVDLPYQAPIKELLTQETKEVKATPKQPGHIGNIINTNKPA